jgi:hypothetical protein
MTAIASRYHTLHYRNTITKNCKCDKVERTSKFMFGSKNHFFKELKENQLAIKAQPAIFLPDMLCSVVTFEMYPSLMYTRTR